MITTVFTSSILQLVQNCFRLYALIVSFQSVAQIHFLQHYKNMFKYPPQLFLIYTGMCSTKSKHVQVQKVQTQRGINPET